MTTDLSQKATWLVTVGTNYDLYYKNNNSGPLSASESGWTNWGGDVRFEPFTLHIWDNGIDVFSINPATGALRMKYSQDINNPVSSSDGWFNLGGVCAGGPVAVCYNVANKYNAVYVVGMDGNVYQCAYTPSGGWGWAKLSLSDYRTPAFQPDKIYASTDGKGRIDVVGVAADNNLYHRYWNSSVWSQWVAVGLNGVASRPFCATLNADRCDIVVRDSHDFKLYHTAIDKGVFLGWQKVADEPVTFDPAGCKFSDGRFDIAAILNATGELVHTWNYIVAGKLGTWRNGFEKHGGVFSSSPKISVRNGSIDMFGRGMDAAIYYKYWDGGKFNGFYKLGGIHMSKPC